MIIKIGTMYTTVDFQYNTLLQEKVRKKMHHKLGVKQDGYLFSKAYKSGYWDGIIDFYDMKKDRFKTGLLHQFLEGIRELQKEDPTITYEIEDNRPPQLVHPDSIDEEVVLGNGDDEDITLRDYQYESVKAIFEEQIGIVNVSTNGGKTEIAAGFIQQVKPYLKRGERIMFVVHSKELLHQSAERIRKRLNLRERDIGKVGDGKFNIKNKQIVFAMVPTLASSLKDPKKGISFTHNERVIKFIAEQVAPKFINTQNTRHLLRNYIKNCTLTTKVWESALEHLQYIAYDNRFTDKSAQMKLKSYIAEFDKIVERKNSKKFKRYKEAKELLESVRVLIIDEFHRYKAETWYDTVSLCENAQYRVGLTGTVDKKDKLGWQRLRSLCNDVIVKISNDYLITRGFSSKPTIRLVPIKEPRDLELINNFQEAYKKGIVENDVRNETIAKLVQAYKKIRPGGVLISVKEIEHGERVLELLHSQGLDAEFIHGGSTDEHRTKSLERFSKGELEILVASTIMDEGIDVKSIGCMILAAGGKSMRQQLQRIGRGLRLNGIDGNQVMVFDFYDLTNRFLKNHSKERINIFKNENFDVKMLGE